MTVHHEDRHAEKDMNAEDKNPVPGDVVPAHTSLNKDHEVESPGSSRMLMLLFALVVLGAIVYGIRSRSSSEKALEQSTAEAAVMSVHVVTPSIGADAQDLTLPGNVQAFTDTPIYSRTDGYLKRWYFDIGAHVRKGQLLAEIETPEIDQQLMQSRAELERIQANMELAGVTSKRWDNLLAKHAVSQQEADQAKSNYIAAQAAVDASKANVRRLEQLQSYERIIAPFNGIITARNTDIGDLIQAGSGSASPRELFHLAAVEKLRVYVSVPEVYADSIDDGDNAIVTQDSSPGLKINGRIVRNASAIDHATRTLNVEVDVDNSKGILRPGAYVFVHFKLPVESHTFTIPSNTLLFRSEGLRVGVVKDGRVQLVPISIGHDYGNSVQVVSGLSPTDQIIVDPSDSLTSGMEVRAQAAAAKGRP
ncbi:MAG: efflux RND transporter periplasmic adaptor subunit [Edaphobacter sp.]|uniref:efflux RND transporter periplasmic adaptor subunit n=1 Tax=Edaphobacter sp. TaxID=1934404 RepID=UPI002387B075|nr:efflux RND transporter periplasmic adaptor subunit [Edaphobacter sp.]MDE1175167.1 efflux RND transporter periplasmic adaptor subunit [Edaphobacter sp.]